MSYRGQDARFPHATMKSSSVRRPFQTSDPMSRSESRPTKSVFKSTRGNAAGTSRAGRLQTTKYTVLTAQKSSMSREIPQRRVRDELGGQSIPRMAARKTQEESETLARRYYIKGGVLRRVESDSESDFDGDDVGHPTISYPLKAARKIDPSGNWARKTGQPARLAARKIETVIISSDDEEPPSSESDSEEAYHDLVEAFAPLTILTHLQRRRHRSSPRSLPFLARNLRKCFLAACEKEGIPTSPMSVPRQPVQVLLKYRLQDSDSDTSSEHFDGEDGWQEHDGGMLTVWACPICDLHGSMNTREMVEYHLQHDHDEVDAAWTELDGQWQVVISLRSDRFKDQTHVEPEDVSSTAEPDILTLDSLSSPTIIATEEHREVSATEPSLDAANSSPLVKHKRELLEFDFRRMSSFEEGPIDPLCTGITEDGTLVPPPKENKLGPAARYPYLREGMISCRPGGPKIYDLLNELPMEEFGIMSWAIIDREEEIFELEDLRDEDKVMHALWNRWIMFNRVDFIFCGYYEGVKNFIDKYYKMVHRAAGWNALRMFLLMLTADRFLTLSEVRQALDYYESQVGMNSWYKN